MEFNIGDNLDLVSFQLLNLPGTFKNAANSALKSTGYESQRRIRPFIKNNEAGWPALHPVTIAIKRKKGNDYISKFTSPLELFAQLVRYRVDEKDSFLHVDFGDSRQGKPGNLSARIVDLLKLAQGCRTVSLSERRRKHLAAMGFLVKRGVKSVKIPRREIMPEVLPNLLPKLPVIFKEKFYKALDRKNKK